MLAAAELVAAEQSDKSRRARRLGERFATRSIRMRFPTIAHSSGPAYMVPVEAGLGRRTDDRRGGCRHQADQPGEDRLRYRRPARMGCTPARRKRTRLTGLPGPW